MPKVSVIVPAYNARAYLRECLDSLRAQTLTDIEVLMVNDGSTDGGEGAAGAEGGEGAVDAGAGVGAASSPAPSEPGTLAIMHEYAAADPRFFVIDKPNGGYGQNINLGIAHACGEYVGILESDDFAEPDFLETLYTMAHEHDLDVARAQFWCYWSTPRERNLLESNFSAEECSRVLNTAHPTATPGSIDRAPYFVIPAIWSGIYKTSFLRDNRITCLETPGASFQDTSFNFKVWACAERVMCTQRAFVHYRQDNEASSINNPGKVYAVCREYDEIERWLTEERPQLVNALRPVVQKLKWKVYFWNFERVAPQFKREFAEHMREVFAQIPKADLAANPRFTVEEHRQIRVLLQDVELFCAWRTPVADGAGLKERLHHKFVTWRALQMTR